MHMKLAIFSRALACRPLLCLCVAMCVAATSAAQTKPKRTALDGDAPAAILCGGNSFFYYNNSMHNHVLNLVRAVDQKSTARATSVTISGSGTDWHDVDSYIQPN